MNAARAGTRLDAALAQARRTLEAAGVEEAALDARLLVCAAAGVTHATLVARPESALDAEQAARLAGWLARREAGEPVSRILGRRGFWSLDLLVTPDVLDPRPDTETLVEAALDHVAGRRGEALRIVDLGVGSGAILAALLVEAPGAFGVGVDASEAAARVARRNLARAGLAARSCVIVADWDRALAGPFDLVLSNPPYIASADIAGLAPEVRLHDPRAALDGGADGLDAYRSLAPAAARLLAPGGAALFEVGAGQAQAVTALLAGAGLAPLAPRRDAGGVARVAGAVSNRGKILGAARENG